MFRREREKAVLRAFLRLQACPTCKVAYELIGERPSPRYWISEERALAVYTKVSRGWTMPRVHRRRRAMYKELCGRIDCLMVSDPSLDIQTAVTRAVHSPASSFFLSPSMIGHILNRALAHGL